MTFDSPLPTESLLEFEVSVNFTGYLTLLNLGSSGNLNVLIPRKPNLACRIEPAHPRRQSIQLTGPAGTDCFIFMWTRNPFSGTLQQWQKRLESDLIDFPVNKGLDRDAQLLDDHLAPAPADEIATVVSIISHGCRDDLTEQAKHV